MDPVTKKGTVVTIFLEPFFPPEKNGSEKKISQLSSFQSM
jgi:hypothetical protein